MIINMLLVLINIGSTAAFNAFTSLSVAAFYVAFIIPALMLIRRRITGQGLRFGPFTLGRAGIAIAVFALGYSFIGAFFSFWPQVVKPSPAEMNWAVVVFAGVIAFSLVYWVLVARHTFTGPIVETSSVHTQLAEEPS